MDAIRMSLHPTYMAKRKPRHFLREWRAYHGLSLEQVAERIALRSAELASADPDERPMKMTHATLSRIERGKLPYNQHLLEILAVVYNTDVASLLWRDPLAADAIWSIWEALSPVQREQATAVLEALKKTGTHG